MIIRPAVPTDALAIDALLDTAFGRGRHMRTAAKLRESARPIAGPSLVAICDHDSDCPPGIVGDLLGSIQFWPIMLVSGEGQIPLTLLGPVAVAAPARSLGLGRRLIAASLGIADAMALEPILLIGDLSYYGRFGFSATATAGWTLPGPVERERLLLRGGDALPRVGDVVADSVARANRAMAGADG